MPPAASTAAAVSSSLSRPRATSTTSPPAAPIRSAVTAPMPDDAPVISATLPLTASSSPSPRIASSRFSGYSGRLRPAALGRFRAWDTAPTGLPISPMAVFAGFTIVSPPSGSVHAPMPPRRRRRHPSATLVRSRGSGGLASADDGRAGVLVDAVGRADLDVGQPGVGERTAKAGFGERAGDAPGPRLHVGARDVVHALVGDHVGDGEAPAGAQDARGLG